MANESTQNKGEQHDFTISAMANESTQNKGEQHIWGRESLLREIDVGYLQVRLRCWTDYVKVTSGNDDIISWLPTG